MGELANQFNPASGGHLFSNVGQLTWLGLIGAVVGYAVLGVPIPTP